MSEKTVYLNLASMNLALAMLNNLEDVRAETARKARAVRKALLLRDAAEEIQNLVDAKNEIVEKVRLANAAERTKVEEAAKRKEDYEPKLKKEPSELSWDELSETEVREYKIDQDVLAWFKKVLDDFRWDRQKVPTQRGEEIEIKIQVTVAMMQAIADLEDALLAAMEKKEPNGENEKAK